LNNSAAGETVSPRIGGLWFLLLGFQIQFHLSLPALFWVPKKSQCVFVQTVGIVFFQLCFFACDNTKACCLPGNKTTQNGIAWFCMKTTALLPNTSAG